VLPDADSEVNALGAVLLGACLKEGLDGRAVEVRVLGGDGGNRTRRKGGKKGGKSPGVCVAAPRTGTKVPQTGARAKLAILGTVIDIYALARCVWDFALDRILSIRQNPVLMADNNHSPSGATLTDLILETFRLNGRLLAVGDRLTAPLGLTSARWQVLGAIAAGPLPVAQIARNMGLTRQSVQRTVDLLEDEGLVAFAPNPNHRRAKLVGLTTEGSHRLDAVSRGQIRWANDHSRSMRERDLATAVRVLREFRERLERDEEEST
jgi:DNA-binding MarR family transcriptional regulator